MPCARGALGGSNQWSGASFLRELAERLKELDVMSKETSRQLRVSMLPAVDGRTFTEPVLDHALASLERLDEIAGAMMGRLDELLTAA
jgi:hypothetical protein